MIVGGIKIEDKQMLSEQTSKQLTTTLTMFEENQVGYIVNTEGNIKTYIFYYKDNNDVWNYKDINASKTKVEKIQNENSRFEEIITTKSYCKFEKKSKSKDYITTTEDVEYILYLNPNQMVQIITD